MRYDSIKTHAKGLSSGHSTSSSSSLWKISTCERRSFLTPTRSDTVKVIQGHSHVHSRHSASPRESNNPADIEHRSPAYSSGGLRSRSADGWWPENKEHEIGHTSFDALLTPLPPVPGYNNSTPELFTCFLTPSHLTGHSDLGFGGRLWPQTVGVTGDEAHPPQQRLYDLLKETVVPKELCS